MNPELDALIQAFEAMVEASDHDYQRLRSDYEGRLKELAERTGKSLEILHKAIETRHAQWVRAQKQPPTVPPTA
jgi:hypothetical protein